MAGHSEEDGAGDGDAQGHHVALARLARTAPVDVTWRPGAAEAGAVADELGLQALRKPVLTGQLRAVGRRDWDLEARLGATVVQACVRTLAPVTTRIDEPVIRRFRADAEPVSTEAEAEMPEDDTVEPLPAAVDLAAVFTEALALAVPSYPLASDTDPADLRVAPPGVTPLTDDDVKPLSALGALRGKLEGDDGGA